MTPRRRSPTPDVQQPDVAPQPLYPCPDCTGVYKSKIGLGVHRRHRHPVEANEEICVERKKKQWSAEEKQLMARMEAAAVAAGCRFINKELAAKVPGRSLDAIKGARRDPEYKALVAAALEEMRTATSGAPPPDDVASSSPPAPCPPRHTTPQVEAPEPPSGGPDGFHNTIRSLIPEVEGVAGWQATKLASIAKRFLRGSDPKELIGEWFGTVFPPTRPPQRRTNRRAPPTVEPISNKARKRLAYAKVQRAFRVNIAAAARSILDATPEDEGGPDVRTMAEHWGPFVSTPSAPAPAISPNPAAPELEQVWHPVSCEEVADTTMPLKAAAGPDGVSVRLWRATPTPVKALLYNVVLAAGGFPAVDRLHT